MKNIICPRCCGNGKLENYKHVEDGICFKCSGKGTIEVEDHIEDTIKILREMRIEESKIEKEFNELYNSVKDEINDDWKWRISNKGNIEDKLKVLKSYIAYNKEIREYIKNNPSIRDKDLDEILNVFKSIELKYI